MKDEQDMNSLNEKNNPLLFPLTPNPIMKNTNFLSVNNKQSFQNPMQIPVFTPDMTVQQRSILETNILQKQVQTNNPDKNFNLNLDQSLIVVPNFVVENIQNEQPVNEIPSIPILWANCNCKNSGCLKLYCDCFKNQRFCNEYCNCIGCENNNLNQKKVENQWKAMQKKLELQNQSQKSKEKDSDKKKQGITCNCQNSECLKKYCECFQNGQVCNDNCTCVNCKNNDKDSAFQWPVVQQNVKQELLQKLNSLKQYLQEKLEA